MIGSRAGRVKDAYGAGYAGRAPARSWTRPPARRTRQLSGAGSRLRHTPNRANRGPKPSSNERLRSPADTGKAGALRPRWRTGRTTLIHKDVAGTYPPKSVIRVPHKGGSHDTGFDHRRLG